MKEMRREERYDDFGRVDCSEMCIVSGILDDISLTGCKVTYNVPPVIDMEKEYEIKLRLSRKNTEPLNLFVTPAWIREEDGKTLVGFSILQSKDSAKLASYISLLKNDNANIEELITQEDTASLFV